MGPGSGAQSCPTRSGSSSTSRAGSTARRCRRLGGSWPQPLRGATSSALCRVPVLVRFAVPHPRPDIHPRPVPHPPSTPGAQQPAGCFLLLVAPSRAMSWHALQKRVGGLFSRRRQQSPYSSPSGQPCAAATAASEPREKLQGRLHRAAARGDLAWLRRWRWYFKRVGIDGRDQQSRSVLWATDGTPWLFLAGAAAAASEPSSTSPRQLSLKEKAHREHLHGATNPPGSFGCHVEAPTLKAVCGIAFELMA